MVIIVCICIALVVGFCIGRLSALETPEVERVTETNLDTQRDKCI